MDKYLIRKPRTQDSFPMQDSSPMQDSFLVQDSSSSSKRISVDFNLENLSSDPGLRQKISSYQPVLRDFPVSHFSEKPC